MTFHASLLHHITLFSTGQGIADQLGIRIVILNQQNGLGHGAAHGERMS